MVYPFKGLLTLRRIEKNSTSSYTNIDVLEFDEKAQKWNLVRATTTLVENPRPPIGLQDDVEKAIEAAFAATEQ